MIAILGSFSEILIAHRLDCVAALDAEGLATIAIAYGGAIAAIITVCPTVVKQIMRAIGSSFPVALAGHTRCRLKKTPF